MNEPRNRSRKVTRKAGPPAENETASNEAASPVFQAPATDAGNSAQDKPCLLYTSDAADE